MPRPLPPRLRSAARCAGPDPIIAPLFAAFLALWAFAVADAAPAAALPGVPRQAIPLDGTWEGATTPAGTPLDAVEAWRPQPVPGIARITMREPAGQLWVRRTIEVPASWRGRRVFVHLGGALYHPHVYLDGKLMGERLDGWHPLEVEITGAVTPGASHELAILTLDQAAVYDAGVPRGGTYTDAARRGKVLAPIGGYKDFLGPWDGVTLRTTPAVRLDAASLVINPSVRRETLAVSGRVDPPAGGPVPAGLRVEAAVIDDDDVLLGAGADVGADGRWSLEPRFENAPQWSPEDPHLLHLRLRLVDAQGAVIDELTERFGFREFWAQGPDFYLNGVKRHLLAESEWPPSRPISRAEIRAKLQGFKDTHAIAFRTHLGGWQKAWFEVADELGMLMIPETALYTDGEGMYAYDDDRFWANMRDHTAHMLGAYRNHASVVMFSLGNEILFMGNAGRATDLPRKLGDLARFARSIAPEHLYTFEADIDPDGAYDVIGLHYPHEVPANFAYPNTGDWLATRKETEAGGGMLGQTRSDFFWDRQKPLYIGEYLWAPFEDYSVGTVYFGETAYQHRLRYWSQAKYAAHHDQTLAYRRAGVSGLCPWATFDDPHDYYRHVGAFLYSHDQRVYPGRRFEAAFDVFNDGPAPLELTLRTEEASGRVGPIERSLALAPGGYQRVVMPIETPDAPGELSLQTTLLAGGDAVHRTEHVLEVWAPAGPLAAALPPGVRLVAYDPSGRWPGSVRTLDALASVDDPASVVLLIAPDALGGPGGGDGPVVVGEAGFDTRAFLAFANAGGRVVVLEQQTLAPLGLGLELVDHAATMTFAIDPSHPLLAGLDAQSLKHWRGDHYVSRREIVRPEAGGGRGVVVSGGPRSLRQGPVAEVPIGRGHAVLLQALVGEKAGSEPAADRLLRNAVGYLAGLPADPPGRTVVLGPDAALRAALDAAGVAYDALDRPATPADLAGAQLVIVQGGGDAVTASAETLADFQARGGVVYWRQPKPDALRTLGPALGAPGLRLAPLPATASILHRHDPLLRGVSREDLTHTTDPTGWRRFIALRPTADLGVVPAEALSPGDTPLLSRSARELSLPDMPWIDHGNRGVRRGEALAFPSLGFVRVEVDAPEAGLYPLTLHAESSSTAGHGPQAQVHVDDVFAASIQPEALGEYTALIALPRGPSTLTLVIDRGESTGPFGTLTLHRVTIGQRLAYPGNAEVLTLPGSLVRVGGGLVLDTHRLEADGLNAAKSRRYLSAVLANLGARFRAPEAGPATTALPLDRFSLIGESPYYEPSPARLTIRSNAVIRAPFTAARAGTYGVVLRGLSSPYQGEFCRVHVRIDGREIGELELDSRETTDFGPLTAALEPGEHTLEIAFFNDGSGGGEDRNLLLDQVRFVSPQ